MRKLNCLLAAAGAMMVSFGAHAGDIYEFANISAVEHENYESSTFNTTLTGVLVGQTQVVTLSVPLVASACSRHLYTMLEQPGAYTLRLDIEWTYTSTGAPWTQYARSCKLQRT